VILATDRVVRQAHLTNIADMLPRLDLDVPRTSDELKRIKKVAREKSVENIEKLFVLEALKRNAWNVTRSAEETGMQRANFQALMKNTTSASAVRNKTPTNPGLPDAGRAPRKAGRSLPFLKLAYAGYFLQ